MYTSEEALKGPLQPGDRQVIQTLLEALKRFVQPDDCIICPLGLGRHVDHRLTRRAAERLGWRLWYYADYPYVLQDKRRLKHMEQAGWMKQVFPITQEGLAAWQDAIAEHSSQISTFWESELEMRQAVSDYLQMNGGIRLWRKPST